VPQGYELFIVLIPWALVALAVGVVVLIVRSRGSTNADGSHDGNAGPTPPT
jgi:hypothetical protein